MSILATWSHVVQSRDVSPHNFDGLAMSGLAFSVAPNLHYRNCVFFHFINLFKVSKKDVHKI